MSRNIIIFIIILLVIIVSASILLGSSSVVKARQPSQPTSGPGGSSYEHQEVKKNVYGKDEYQYWLFEPESPTPDSAPVIVFNHGWAATDPTMYQTWINHMVKRGYIVIYPRYQVDIFTPSDNFTSNSITATKDALNRLQSGGHVLPDLDRFAIVGHSAGGLISVNMAALALENGLPEPKAVFAVEPGKSRSAVDKVGPVIENLQKIPSNTLLLALAGDKDTWVGNQDAIKIIRETSQIPSENKDYVLMVSDDHGRPAAIANHFAPLSPSIDLGFQEIHLWTDAMDYYGVWKLFDALTDAAFYGKNRDYALGNTSQQRFMGTWSDNIPLRELFVTDNP